MKTPYRYLSHAIATALMGMTLTTGCYAYDFHFVADNNSQEFTNTQLYRDDSGPIYTVDFIYSHGPLDNTHASGQVDPEVILMSGTYDFTLSNDPSSSQLFLSYVDSNGGLNSLCGDLTSCSTCQNIPESTTDVTVNIIPSSARSGYALQCKY